MGDLRAYRRNFRAAEESEAVIYVHAALGMLEREEPPVENPLLISICFASLRSMMMAVAEEARPGAGE